MTERIFVDSHGRKHITTETGGLPGGHTQVQPKPATDFSIWSRATLETLCREAMDKVHELQAKLDKLTPP